MRECSRRGCLGAFLRRELELRVTPADQYARRAAVALARVWTVSRWRRYNPCMSGSFMHKTLLGSSLLAALVACPHPPARSATAAGAVADLTPRSDRWSWIVRHGDNFTAKRGPLREALDPAVTDRPGYALPFRGEDGQVVGVQLHSVTEDAPVYHLGFRTGDVVLSVNEFALTSPSTLFQAWTELQLASRAEVVFLRDGQRTRHTYVLADSL
jgi:hypothetical protein